MVNAGVLVRRMEEYLAPLVYFLVVDSSQPASLTSSVKKCFSD